MQLIANKHYNGLIVVDDNDKVVGVLSVQDIAAAIVPKDFQENTHLAQAMYKEGFFQERCHELRQRQVMQFMRTDFMHVTMESSVMEVCADFLKNDLYIVPVFDKKKAVLGIITRSEIKRIINQSMNTALPSSSDTS